jgi:hypothetical protein
MLRSFNSALNSSKKLVIGALDNIKLIINAGPAIKDKVNYILKSGKW